MIRLNLGCGDKLYKKEANWINVDIVPPKEIPEGIEFVEADLVSLPFEDNYADEIHAYHVIEHFYRVDVPKVLTEWLRVLKPGGKVFLEQPDMLKCAANIIHGIALGNEQEVNRLGILGLYGDGTPEQPYMGHRWGWYPQSLGKVLESVGFKDIHVAPALTHMRDIRDFRIVGTK